MGSFFSLFPPALPCSSFHPISSFPPLTSPPCLLTYRYLLNLLLCLLLAFKPSQTSFVEFDIQVLLPSLFTHTTPDYCPLQYISAQKYFIFQMFRSPSHWDSGSLHDALHMVNPFLSGGLCSTFFIVL